MRQSLCFPNPCGSGVSSETRNNVILLPLAALAFSVTAPAGPIIPSSAIVPVMITGTIAEDGIIGPAGAVTEKARAAKGNNITLFLVSEDTPDPQGFGKQRDCRITGSIEYCEINYVQKDTNLTLE